MIGTAFVFLACVKAQSKTEAFRLPDELLAGRYYEGDGLGVNHLLTLTTDHHFTFSGHTDAGASESDKGSWTYEGDVLVLKPERPIEEHNWTGTATRFVPVRWGDAVTLVKEANCPGFFATRNQDPAAMDKTHSLDYRKLKASTFESIPRQGPMQYPLRFSDFVANGPVLATVKSIASDGTASIVTSTPKRLKVGMTFTTSDWSEIDVEITKIGSASNFGKVYYFFNSDRLLKVGDKLTTGGRYVTPHSQTDQRLKAPPKRS